jgi:hypothetical protein
METLTKSACVLMLLAGAVNQVLDAEAHSMTEREAIMLPLTGVAQGFFWFPE